jgi:hypothetical protein
MKVSVLKKIPRQKWCTSSTLVVRTNKIGFGSLLNPALYSIPMSNKKSSIRNPIKVAMDERYAHTTTKMRDRRERRMKDARKSWRREEH